MDILPPPDHAGHDDAFCLFAGSTHPALAAKIAGHLGLPLARSKTSRFSDGETFFAAHDNVRGRACYLVQPTCAAGHAPGDASGNDAVMELLIMADALRRASSGTITAVIPYFGYARQDRKVSPRTPITASLVARLLQRAGVDRVITVDLHADQIQGFFDVPVDNLYASYVLVPRLRALGFGPETMIVSPDAGGVARARAYAKTLGGASLAIIDKRRERANESEVMHIIGEVAGRDCLVIDDMIDTAGTLVKGAQALMDAGAKSVSACASHAVLSGPAYERIGASPLSRVIVTDSIPLGSISMTRDMAGAAKLDVVSLAPLLGEAIRRVHYNHSVSGLFVS